MVRTIGHFCPKVPAADALQTASGRALYEALQLQTRYNYWFKRMCEYGFIEGTDYSPIMTNRSDGKAGICSMMIQSVICICAETLRPKNGRTSNVEVVRTKFVLTKHLLPLSLRSSTYIELTTKFVASSALEVLASYVLLLLATLRNKSRLLQGQKGIGIIVGTESLRPKNGRTKYIMWRN